MGQAGGTSACPESAKSKISECTSLASCGSCSLPGAEDVTIETDWAFADEGREIDVLQGSQAENEQLAWINYVAGVMWPYMRKAMMKKADKIFREKMGEELGKHPEVKLTELTLHFDPGETPPTLKRMRVYYRDQQERQAVQVDNDFSWEPDENFHVRFTVIGKARTIPIKAVDIGISNLKIRGTLSCLLSPLLNYEPCVGTGQAFFLDTPAIQMTLNKVKKLGTIGSVITTVMEGVVGNVLAEGYILPHRFTQKIKKDLPLETYITCKSPLPLGVLQIEILEAKDLAAADTSMMGKKSSDPFVLVKVGFDQYRTSTIENTCDPVWADPPGHLFVYNATQIVRITIKDDDLMQDDFLGQVLGYNIVNLCRECETPEGVWLDVVECHDPTKPAGKLKVRVRYYDVASAGDLKVPTNTPSAKDPPYLLTVKMLGLEGEDRGDMRNVRATIEQMNEKGHGEAGVHEDKIAVAEKHKHNRMMAGLEHAANFVSSEVKAAKAAVRAKTGLGFGHREDGAPPKRKSGKAFLWGTSAGGKAQTDPKKAIPPLVIRAMEKLYINEKWKLKEIAEAFGMDEKVVETTVSLRGNFEVVWCEALHFLQPSANPFQGKLKVSVQAPPKQQVRGADDHGYIGEFIIDLEKTGNEDLEAKEGSTGNLSPTGGRTWYRRVRRELIRKKSKSTKKKDDEKEKHSLSAASMSASLKGLAERPKADSDHSDQSKGQAGGDRTPSPRKLSETQVSTSEKDDKVAWESTGILMELLIEFRALTPATCQLEPGQCERTKEELLEATMHSGVVITKA